MIRLEQVLPVSEFLRLAETHYGSEAKLRAYVKRRPKDIVAKLDLEDLEYYSKRPEMQYEKLRRAVSLIPVTDEALSIFTKQRLSLLEALASRRVESVRQLAKDLRRDVHNVHQDLTLFHRLGMIEFGRGPRNSRIPRLLADSITIIPDRVTAIPAR